MQCAEEEEKRKQELSEEKIVKTNCSEGHRIRMNQFLSKRTPFVDGEYPASAGRLTGESGFDTPGKSHSRFLFIDGISLSKS